LYFWALRQLRPTGLEPVTCGLEKRKNYIVKKDKNALFPGILGLFGVLSSIAKHHHLHACFTRFSG
jgi:hypothetical protein